MKIDPILHSHISDMLPELHPLAYEHLNCKHCGELVHAANNECMQTWIESGEGNYCLSCFSRIGGPDLEDSFGLET